MKTAEDRKSRETVPFKVSLVCAIKQNLAEACLLNVKVQILFFEVIRPLASSADVMIF
jgi:hypothetical protein